MMVPETAGWTLEQARDLLRRCFPDALHPVKPIADERAGAVVSLAAAQLLRRVVPRIAQPLE